MGRRTDLAEEAQRLWQQEAGQTTELSGVKARQWKENGVERCCVEILDQEGAEALGKPVGCYETIWTAADSRPDPATVQELKQTLETLLALGEGDTVLVVGLGNRDMTPDAIGPLATAGTLVTRKMGKLV